LADLDGYAPQFVDKTTITGMMYNYRYKVYIPGGESHISPQYTLQDASLYGPGDTTRSKGGLLNQNYGPENLGNKFISKADIMNMCGADESDMLGWTDTWHKFSKNGEYYYTACKGYIRLRDSSIIWNKIKSNASFEIDGTTFEIPTNAPIVDISSVLDAFIRQDNYCNPDYPRKNVVMAGADLAGTDFNTTVIIHSRVMPTYVGYWHFPNGNSFRAAFTSYDLTPNGTKTYLWKPVFRLVQNKGGLL
jgi:hypothetical protein